MNSGKKPLMLMAKSHSVEEYIRPPPIQEVEEDIDTIGFFRAAWDLLSYSFHATMINVANTFIETINLMVIGNYFHHDYTCALGIAYCWTNISSYSLLLGMISTIEGRCTEDFERNDPKAAKAYYNRTSIILFSLTLIAIFGLFWYSSILLELINIPHDISILAQGYLRVYSPGFVFLIQYEVSKQYANSLSKENLQGISSSVATIIHIPVLCVMMKYFESGLTAVALATSITQFVNYIGVIVIIWCFDSTEQLESTWDPLEIMKEWWQFIKKNYSNGLLVCVEWLGLELITIESSYLSNVDLAATIIIQNMVSIAFLFSWNISVSSTAFIELATEEENVGDRRRYAIRSIQVFLLILLPGILLLFLLHKRITLLFTNSEDVINKVKNLLEGTIETVIFLDGMQAILGGILRGLGKSHVAFYGNLACYYLLVQPFALSLGFLLYMGIYGFWMSMGVGLFFNIVFYVGVLISQDWKRIEVEWIEFPSERKEILVKSANAGVYNSPDAKRMLMLLQNNS